MDNFGYDAVECSVRLPACDRAASAPSPAGGSAPRIAPLITIHTAGLRLRLGGRCRLPLRGASHSSGGDHGEQHGYGDAEQPRYHLAMALSESPLEQSSPGDRKWAPELAYSWPAVVFALTFPALFVSKILALVFLFGAFVCCPIRDAILDRFWPDSPTCAGS